MNIDDIKFERDFYPFTDTIYKTSNFIKYFKKDVKTDSNFISSKWDTILYYEYYDDSSRFYIDICNYKKKIYKYTIGGFKINSDLIRFKNGIRYNMTRDEFFSVVDCEELNCDTLYVQCSNGYYYRFIFRNDKLKQISLIQVE